MEEVRMTMADRREEGTLRRLWTRLYGDGEDYIDVFFRNRFSLSGTRVLRAGDAAAGVMYLLPCTLRDGRACDYAYAGGIDPAYRGKGLFRMLIAALVRESRENGRLLCCVPGEGLWDFYRSMGFGTLYTRREITVLPGNGEKLEVLPLTPEEHFTMRDVFSGGDTVVWDKAALSYAGLEAKADRGFAVKLKSPDGEWMALGGLRGDTLLVQETTVPELLLETAAGALSQKLGGKTVTFHLPGGENPAEEQPAGLLLGEDRPAQGWMGCTLIL